MPLLLTACSSLSSGVNPVSWWHSLEGGAIAQQRPPPPNADAPYPNLASVPPKPKPPDPAIRARISNALIADRANANYAAAQAPIQPPAARSGSPNLFGAPVPPAPPADPDASSASLPAASAPPPAPAAPPAPTRVARAPVNAPPGTATGPAGPPAAPPTIPNAPPPPPLLPGVAIPVTTVAVPAPVAPPAPPPGPRTATAGDRVPVAFAPGSAIIPPGADAPLKRLVALSKGAKFIDVTGFGEATTDAVDAQTAGVRLGLLRAQAIASVLGVAGVPQSFVRIDAQADGAGGEARIVN